MPKTTEPLLGQHKERIKALREKKKQHDSPVWRGPEEDGITFSLLSRFLVCRERFRLLVCEGLKSADRFNHRIEYGNMWHVCEEGLAKGPDPTRKKELPWEVPLLTYARELAKRYPMDSPVIDHWYEVCKVQFPIYVDYWAKHPDVLDRKPLLQEQVFCVPYKLHSGRVVLLRGKWDSVDLIGKGKKIGLWLQENKTKGDIDEALLQRQLSFDLQTMMYLAALTTLADQTREGHTDNPLPDWAEKYPVIGVRYNVIRRPLSGGRGNISRWKATKNRPEETKEHYYARLRGIIDGTGEDDPPGPGHFFMRWNVAVSRADIDRFKRQCLDPVLENLCDWWAWVSAGGDPFEDKAGLHRHWRHPFGVFNPLDEGGCTDLDNYLDTGSDVGLERSTNLFPELVV